MNFLKKNCSLLSAAIVCLGLSACGDSNNNFDENPDEIVGNDWRVTGVVRDYGTITRCGEDTVVLVCVYTEDAAFYYDTEDQEIFSFVNYPLELADKIALSGSVWDMYKKTDFYDLNSDGNSDVTMTFNDNGSELKAVWFWDTDSEMYLFQPSESNFIDENDGRGDIIPEEDDRGDIILDDDGRGDLIRDEGNSVMVLMGGAMPFSNMTTPEAESFDDGTYYYSDITEDGTITVVNTVRTSSFRQLDQTVEDYLTDCALSLGAPNSYSLQSVKQNKTYTENMT